MEWVRDRSVEHEIRDRLERKYIQNRKDEIHVSDLIHCLTKSFWEKTDKMEPSEAELMYFSTGFAFEEVYLRDSQWEKVEPKEIMGIIMSPDYIIKTRDGEMDLKTTRMWPDSEGVPKKGWPEGWLKQFKAYAYRLWNKESEYVDYHVGILYLTQVPPVFRVFALRFSIEELTENMGNVLSNNEILQRALDNRVAPPPIHTWECGLDKGQTMCKYVERCNLIGWLNGNDAKTREAGTT